MHEKPVPKGEPVFLYHRKVFRASYDTKKPPGRIKLWQRGIILLKGTAAGGESAKSRF